MRPFDQFLHSVQERFAVNRATDVSDVVVAFIVAIILWWLLSLFLRRRRARRDLGRRIRAVAVGAKLNADDMEDLRRIAAAGEQPLLDVMTTLAAFEHATATQLEREPPALRPEPGSWYARVRHLRLALGFSPLSPHLWLLTTRELVIGDSVNNGGSNGHVGEVNEASFAVDWPITTTLVENTMVALTIDRPDDARYVTRARLMKLEVQPAVTVGLHERPAGLRAFFAHDEQPERQQDREHMRLRVNVAVRVQVLDRTGRGAALAAPPPPAEATATPAPGSAPPSALAGKMVDISAGGLALNLPVSADGPILRGARVRCWFALAGGTVFDAVAAVVVGVGPVGGAKGGAATGAMTGAIPRPKIREQHLRLSFSALDGAQRDRLAAAIARHQASSPAAAHGATS